MRTQIAVLCVFLCTAAAAQQPQWRAPRTADGQPDLQGMWTSATITPLERPDEFGDRRALTPVMILVHSFTGEMPFHRTDDAIYEYACHEGNYALRGILAGAREQEKASR